MIELPVGLSRWKDELSIFPEHVALTIGPWLPRLDLVFGPLASNHVTHRGEVDGFGGLTRRGPYERLLVSEWLLALELPDEFARRAAMGEHSFLELARREPKGSQRSVVLFDAGPSQLGTPRLAHLAALIVLAHRARQHGAEFGWGVLQKPDGWCWAALNETSVLGLLEARSAREATAIDLEDWLERLQETEAADDLWIVGAPRLSGLSSELPHEMARSLEKTSRLEVDDILEVGRRAVRLQLHRGQKKPAEVELELPEERACVKLLRDPFDIKPAASVVAPKRANATSNLIFSRDSRKIFVRSGGDLVLALHPPVSPRSQAGTMRLLSAFGDQIVAAGSYDRAFHLITSDGNKLTVRGYSKRGTQQETRPIEELSEEFPFWHPGEKTPLQPCYFWNHTHFFLDPVGRLFALRYGEKKVMFLLSGVTAMGRIGSQLVVVRNAWEQDPQHHRRPRLSSRAIITIDPNLAMSEIPIDLEGDGDMTAFFGFGAQFADPLVGTVAIRQFADRWTIIDKEVRQVTVPEGATVIGVMASRGVDALPRLLIIEKDGRSICSAGSLVARWVRCEEKIVFAAAAPNAARFAWIGQSGTIYVYAVEHERLVYCVLANGREVDADGISEEITGDLP